MSDEKIKSFLDRPLAFVDVETTGLDPRRHEIVEIGLVIVDQRSFAQIGEWTTKVVPVHLETADPAALAVCGYDIRDWHDAIVLPEAMSRFAPLVQGAVFAAHNVTFDWGFVNEAFRQSAILDPMDYHRLDLFSLAWDRLRGSGLENFNLQMTSQHLGLGTEPFPHRALNGARMAYEVFKKLHAV